MIRKPRIILYALICACSTLPAAGFAGEKAVNPHWTGMHCGECHLEGTVPSLRSEGDINALCNRCHERGSESGAEAHVINVAPAEDMKQRMPKQWPLLHGKLSCGTCHDISVQMYKNIARKTVNRNFLRAETASPADFCFACHRKDRFEKKNPHTQLDEAGRIKTASCLCCHTEVPDIHKIKDATRAPLRREPSALCTGCHGAQAKGHPARADHLVRVTKEMKAALTQTENVQAVSLPLAADVVQCTTCHNPHQKGVLQGKAASAGSGEQFFLRLPGSYALCLACHPDTKLRAGTEIKPLQYLLKTPPERMTAHKPWFENKCKACHAVTVEQRKEPHPIMLCFRNGCHETTVVDKPFVHEISVIENCYFCHENHTAEYKKLLKSNEERLCFACHPLLKPGGGGQAAKAAADRSLHSRFTDYMSGLSVAPGNECVFCHSPRHYEQIRSVPTVICADCHITVRTIVWKTAERQQDVHAPGSIAKNKCSGCHDPHGADYRYQLKKPPEEYGGK